MDTDTPVGSRLGETARRRKVSEDVALSLVRFITANGLTDGAMLPNEAKLGEMLRVGRTTLREALRLLETQGVIAIRTGPRGGPVVRAPRSDDLMGAVTLMLEFNRASFETLMQARVVLEPPVAGTAATRITDAELAAIERNLELMEVERNTGSERWMEANEQFHTLVARASGNVLLEMVVATMGAIFTRQRTGVRFGARRRVGVSKDHRTVVDALAARDATAAESAMRRHLEEAYAFYQKNYPELMTEAVSWSG